jgi:hypothetical protein
MVFDRHLASFGLAVSYRSRRRLTDQINAAVMAAPIHTRNASNETNSDHSGPSSSLFKALASTPPRVQITGPPQRALTGIEKNAMPVAPPIKKGSNSLTFLARPLRVVVAAR